MNDYEPHADYNCIDAYKPPADGAVWHACPRCGLRPLVWEYDNGRSTACGCWEDTYVRHSIRAESIMSVMSRCGGSAAEYDPDALRRNWNHWCRTGEDLGPADGNNRW